MSGLFKKIKMNHDNKFNEVVDALKNMDEVYRKHIDSEYKEFVTETDVNKSIEDYVNKLNEYAKLFFDKRLWDVSSFEFVSLRHIAAPDNFDLSINDSKYNIHLSLINYHILQTEYSNILNSIAKDYKKTDTDTYNMAMRNIEKLYKFMFMECTKLIRNYAKINPTMKQSGGKVRRSRKLSKRKSRRSRRKSNSKSKKSQK